MIDEGDYESRLFLTVFVNDKHKPGLRCLEVGAHDAPLATMLCDAGHSVLSFDLRDYDGPQRPGHAHLTGDFTKIWPTLNWNGPAQQPAAFRPW